MGPTLGTAPAAPASPSPAPARLGSERARWVRPSQAWGKDGGASGPAGLPFTLTYLMPAGSSQELAGCLCARTQPQGWLQYCLQIKTTEAITEWRPQRVSPGGSWRLPPAVTKAHAGFLRGQGEEPATREAEATGMGCWAASLVRAQAAQAVRRAAVGTAMVRNLVASLQAQGTGPQHVLPMPSGTDRPVLTMVWG